MGANKSNENHEKRLKTKLNTILQIHNRHRIFLAVQGRKHQETSYIILLTLSQLLSHNIRQSCTFTIIRKMIIQSINSTQKR
jgi:hypothetical protein